MDMNWQKALGATQNVRGDLRIKWENMTRFLVDYCCRDFSLHMIRSGGRRSGCTKRWKERIALLKPSGGSTATAVISLGLRQEEVGCRQTVLCL